MEGAPAAIVAAAVGATNAGVVVVGVGEPTAVSGVGGHTCSGFDGYNTMSNIPDRLDKFLTLERFFQGSPRRSVSAFLETDPILCVTVNMPCHRCCPCGFVYSAPLPALCRVAYPCAKHIPPSVTATDFNA